MLFYVLNIFFDLLLIVLFIRYFVEKYQYYGFGPLLYAIVELSNRLLQPIRRRLPQAARILQNHLLLVAMVLTVLIRGVALWILRAPHPLAMVLPYQGLLGLPYALGLSVNMALTLIGEMVIAFLFASLMISRRGMTLGSSAGFVCFQEKTFAVFHFVKRGLKTDNLVVLFLAATLAILVGTSVLASLVCLSWLKGFLVFEWVWAVTFFEMIQRLVSFYLIVLLLTILSSWVAADQFSVMIQVLRAMSDPYLNIFRRLLPWARIDFVDLSPLFAIIALYPIALNLLAMLEATLLQWLQPQSMLIIHAWRYLT